MANWISLLISILACIALAVFWWQRRQWLLERARADIRQSLSLSRLLVNLLGQLQQHRGMSSAWLSGDAGFHQRLLAKQAEIDGLFPNILKAARLESQQPKPCLSNNDFSLFVFRWRSLIDELPHLSTEQSIAQHSQMIARVLEWLVALGESRLEPLAVDLGCIGAARNFSHRLPQLTECLGQARAIGSSVAARHSCTPVARVRLMFLVGRAETLLAQASAAWAVAPLTTRCHHSIEALASTVRTRMLLTTGVVVSPGDYFALATKAIDDVFAWVEACAQAVDEAAGQAVGPGSDGG